MSAAQFHQIGPGIWDHTELIRFFGAWLPHRMTVIRLEDGTVLVHSPTRCSPETKHALKDLGPVSHIVAPNGMHDLFLNEWAVEFPKAPIWIPPRAEKYFSHVPRAEPLPDNAHDAPWERELTYVPIKGMARLHECVFYHKPSRSLICADLFFHIEKENPPLIRIAARLGGFYQKLGVPADIRWFLVRDRQALRRSIEKLRAVSFENIIVGHGANTIGNGATAFQKATAWLD